VSVLQWLIHHASITTSLQLVCLIDYIQPQAVIEMRLTTLEALYAYKNIYLSGLGNDQQNNNSSRNLRKIMLKLYKTLVIGHTLSIVAALVCWYI